MHTLISLSMALVSVSAPQSPFNSYDVFLTPRNLPGRCTGHDVEQFRNRRYTFGGDLSNPVTLRDGKFVDSPFGTPEFETSLGTAEALKAADRTATLLIIRSQHVHGTGGTTHVLVVECRNRKLTVWFEATGEGIRDASFTESDQRLTVSRWIWSATDGHCCPSTQTEEGFRWSPHGRFVRVR
jgi:hypothetical protein